VRFVAGTTDATSVVLFNSGNVPVAAGTTVHWSMDVFGPQAHDFILKAPLLVGKTIVMLKAPPGVWMGFARAKVTPNCRAGVGPAGR
jgi:hypothetical protein